MQGRRSVISWVGESAGFGRPWRPPRKAFPKERCVASPSPPHPPRMLFYNMFLWVSGRARCPRHLVYLQSKFKICAAGPIQGTPRSVAISGQAARVRSPFLGLLVAMSHGAEGGASDWLGVSPPVALAAAAAAGAAAAADAAQPQAAGAAHHAVPAAQPQAAGRRRSAARGASSSRASGSRGRGRSSAAGWRHWGRAPGSRGAAVSRF